MGGGVRPGSGCVARPSRRARWTESGLVGGGASPGQNASPWLVNLLSELRRER